MGGCGWVYGSPARPSRPAFPRCQPREGATSSSFGRPTHPLFLPPSQRPGSSASAPNNPGATATGDPHPNPRWGASILLAPPRPGPLYLPKATPHPGQALPRSPTIRRFGLVRGGDRAAPESREEGGHAEHL